MVTAIIVLFMTMPAAGFDFVAQASVDGWYPIALVDVTDGYTPEPSAEGNFSSTAEPWPTDVSFSGTTNDVGKISFDPLGALGTYVELTLTGCTNAFVLVTGR